MLQKFQEFIYGEVRLPDDGSQGANGQVLGMGGNRYGTANIGFVQYRVTTCLSLQQETSPLQRRDYFSRSQRR